MVDKTTLDETARSPIDGSESVRLATAGANWKATLASIFGALGGSGTSDVVTPMSFGAFADGTEHAITQTDINNHTEWAGVYDVGTSWDTVALQEAILTATTDAVPAMANAIHVEATYAIDRTKDDNGFEGDRGSLVNGSTSSGGIAFYWYDKPVAGVYISFAFKQGAVIVTEATAYFGVAWVDDGGTWKWQGTNDPQGWDETWTDIGGTFTLGNGTTSQVFTSLNGNSTAYVRYRLLGVSGNAPASGTSGITEIQFKQGGSYVTSARNRNFNYLSVVCKKLYVPRGSYYINRALLIVAQYFELEFSARGSAMLQWHGSNYGPVLITDSLSYSSIYNLAINCQEPAHILWDMNGTGSFGGLKTQQVSVYDMIMFGNNDAANGVWISRRGGAAQGDTILFNNPMITTCVDAGIVIGGQNALSVSVVNGDLQANLHDGIAIYGGSIFVLGTSFQAQAGALYVAPPSNQLILDGADVHFYSGAGDTCISTLRDIRSESEVLCRAIGYTTIDSSATAAAGHNSWYDSYPYLKGHLLKPGTDQNNTQRRSFIVVDMGGPTDDYPLGWHDIDEVNSNTTKIVDPTANWSTNQWQGYVVHMRWSNGYAEHHNISSNTATELFTVGDPFSGAPNQYCLYRIGGKSHASTVPNFDGLAGGHWGGTGGTGQGFSTTINSDQLGVSSSFNPSVNDYVVIPGGDLVGPAGWQTKTALIAKVIANLGGNVMQMSRKASATMSYVGGYWGPGLVDNQMAYIEAPYAAISNAISVSSSYIAAGKIYNPQKLLAMFALRSKPLASMGALPPQKDRFDLVASKEMRQIDFQNLPTTGTVDLTSVLEYADVFVFTPTGNVTLNAPTVSDDYDWPYSVISRRLSIHVVTSGTVSYNITFGNNFRSAGVLATGTVSDKAFVIVFESCKHGIYSIWHEVSRTVAM